LPFLVFGAGAGAGGSESGASKRDRLVRRRWDKSEASIGWSGLESLVLALRLRTLLAGGCGGGGGRSEGGGGCWEAEFEDGRPAECLALERVTLDDMSNHPNADDSHQKRG